MIIRLQRDITIGLVACVLVATIGHRSSVASADSGQVLPWSALQHIDEGVTNRISTPAAAKHALVFIFVTVDCPISNRYTPEVARLAERYRPRGVSFHLVYPDNELSTARIRTHRSEFRLDLPAWRDPGQILVAAAKAQVTPEAAVFSVDGRLLYHGRIDDRYAGFGQRRQRVTRRDLAEALEAVAAGKTPSPSEVPAVGCRIPKLR